MGGLSSTTRISSGRMAHSSSAGLNSTARMGLNSTARMDLNSTVRMDLNSTARVDRSSMEVVHIDLDHSSMVQTDSKVKAASAVGLTELRTIYTTLMLVCRTPRQPRRKRKLDVGEIALMAGCWCCCPLNVSGM